MFPCENCIVFAMCIMKYREKIKRSGMYYGPTAEYAKKFAIHEVENKCGLLKEYIRDLPETLYKFTTLRRKEIYTVKFFESMK